MDYSAEILEELKKNNDLKKKEIELLEKLYFIFSKYDSQYLTELENDGFNPPTG